MTAASMITPSQASDVLPADSLLLTIVGALALIILLMVALAWLFRRSGLAHRLNDGQHDIRVVASKSLGARERLVVVDVGEQRLVLGVTAAQITCLATQQSVAEPSRAAATPAAFPALLETLRQKYRKD